MDFNEEIFYLPTQAPPQALGSFSCRYYGKGYFFFKQNTSKRVSRRSVKNAKLSWKTLTHLPLDCIGIVCQFFHKGKNFVSLMKTCKHFYENFSNSFSYFGRNIIFRYNDDFHHGEKDGEKKIYQFVHHLKFDSKKFQECKDISVKVFRKYDRSEDEITPKLTITTNYVRNVFLKHLPNLNKLELICNQRVTLDLSFLRHFLRLLKIKNVYLEDKILRDFVKLKKFSVYGKNNLFGFENVPNLETLELGTIKRGSGFFLSMKNFHLTEISGVEKFPKLKNLILNVDNFENFEYFLFNGDNNRNLKISNLNLEALQIYNLDSIEEITIENLNSLRLVKVFRLLTNKVVFRDISFEKLEVFNINLPSIKSFNGSTKLTIQNWKKLRSCVLNGKTFQFNEIKGVSVEKIFNLQDMSYFESDKTPVAFLQNCPNITYIKLHTVKELNPGKIGEELERFKNLQQIHICVDENFIQNSDFRFQNLENVGIISIEKVLFDETKVLRITQISFKNMPKLRRLGLFHCVYYNYDNFREKLVLIENVELINLPSLKSLDINARIFVGRLDVKKCSIAELEIAPTKNSGESFYCEELKRSVRCLLIRKRNENLIKKGFGLKKNEFDVHHFHSLSGLVINTKFYFINQISNYHSLFDLCIKSDIGIREVFNMKNLSQLKLGMMKGLRRIENLPNLKILTFTPTVNCRVIQNFPSLIMIVLRNYEKFVKTKKGNRSDYDVYRKNHIFSKKKQYLVKPIPWEFNVGSVVCKNLPIVNNMVLRGYGMVDNGKHLVIEKENCRDFEVKFSDSMLGKIVKQSEKNEYKNINVMRREKYGRKYMKNKELINGT